MAARLQRFFRDTSGATAIEYCMIAGIISMAIVAGVTSIGTKLNSYFVQIAAVN